MKSIAVLKVLVIDDSLQNLELIREALDQEGVQVVTSEDPEVGFELFLEHRPRVVLVDMVMPKVNGLEILKRIVATDPGTDVILMTGYYTTESAVEAIQKGACDYLAKPLHIGKLRERIAGILAEVEKRRQTLRLDQEMVEVYQFEGMVARSPLMLDVFARIRRVAPHYRTVLVNGATGTGKELVAQALHRLSPAKQGPFVICNCSALVETLLESELFGYVRGAFTGANQDRAGLFEQADGGTIFLDEIGELSLPAQAKLLRVLQNRQVQRVGSSTNRPIDVRVVAATHRDLKAMVRDGSFREDLYYRLAMVDISLPALAERREDLPLLERHFIKKFSLEYNKPISGLTRRAQARMAVYPWPGNIRELENVLGNACMMVEGNLIDISDLHENVRLPDQNEDDPGNGIFLPLDEVERRHVLRVLEAVGGNKAKAAEILGIGRGTVYQILSKMKVLEKGESA